MGRKLALGLEQSGLAFCTKLVARWRPRRAGRRDSRRSFQSDFINQWFDDWRGYLAACQWSEIVYRWKDLDGQ